MGIITIFCDEAFNFEGVLIFEIKRGINVSDDNNFLLFHSKTTLIIIMIRGLERFLFYIKV